MRFFPLAAIASLAALSPFPATAATFGIFGFTGGDFFAPQPSSTPLFDMATGNSGSPGSVSTVSASANFGSVGASSTSAHVVRDSTIETGRASASFADNVTFTRDPDGPSVVPVSLNLDFGGIFNAGSGTDSGFGQATYRFSVGFGSQGFTGLGGFDTLFGTSFIPSGLEGGEVSAILPGPDGFSIPLVTPKISLNFGSLTSVMLRVSLGVDVSTTASGEGGSATANFGNTLEFARGRPVFDLPEGVTANAGDYLVNNFFVAAPPPPPAPDPSVIPLPAGLPLLAGALGLMAVLRRRA